MLDHLTTGKTDTLIRFWHSSQDQFQIVLRFTYFKNEIIEVEENADTNLSHA